MLRACPLKPRIAGTPLSHARRGRPHGEVASQVCGGSQGAQEQSHRGALCRAGKKKLPGFRVWCLGFGVWGLGFRVQGLGFRV